MSSSNKAVPPHLQLLLRRAECNETRTKDTTLALLSVKRKKFVYEPVHQNETDRPVHSHETQCSPFRFMDLPRELRNLIYECLVDTGHVYEEFRHKYRATHNRVRTWDEADCCRTASCPGRATPPRFATPSPQSSRSPSPRIYWDATRLKDDRLIARRHHVDVLCQVSREFREEILKHYYSGNAFEVDAPMHTGPEVVQEWAHIVGMERLRHINDLTATFHYYKGGWDAFHVTHSSNSGLRAKVQETGDWDYPPWESKGDEHIAAVEKIKTEEKWGSTGVVEFFTLDPDAVRHILWGPFIKLEDEEVLVNEHDAYQVAYGRPYVYLDGSYPW